MFHKRTVTAATMRGVTISVLLFSMGLVTQCCKRRDFIHNVCHSTYRDGSQNTGIFTCYKDDPENPDCNPMKGYCETLFWKCKRGNIFDDPTNIPEPCETLFWKCKRGSIFDDPTN